MTVREVLQLGNPLLRQKCARVSNPHAPEIQEIGRDLADTVAHWKKSTGYGRGIAAPQIGVLQRVIYLSVPEPRLYINPEIIRRSEETMEVWDACLSFLCIFMKVRRHKTITLRYQDTEGKSCELEAGAAHDLAELLQHEIDHLDGILAIDRMTDVRSVCTREEFERRFRSSSPYAEGAA